MKTAVSPCCLLLRTLQNVLSSKEVRRNGCFSWAIGMEIRTFFVTFWPTKFRNQRGVVLYKVKLCVICT